MRFRYIYLDPDGVETKVESLEELRRCVEDGLVGENTLLYDAVSREWGPARVHTAYRTVIGDTEDPPDAEASSEESAGDVASISSDDGAGGSEGAAAGVDLGQSPDSDIVLSDEVPDTVGRFLERRARERREEDERRATALDDLHIVDQGSAWSGTDVAEPDEEMLSPALPASGGDEPTTPRPSPSPVTMKVNASGGRGRRRNRMMVIAGSVVTVVALLASQSLLGRDEAAEAADTRVDTGPPPAANPELEARIQEAEGSAFQDMVQAMDSLRGVYEVSGGPRDWLHGRYLASASAYPDVEDYWRRYRNYVAELSARDEEMFRTGFVERLQSTGLEGPVLSMRLARSTEEFRASGASRDSVYAAMDGMARAALDLHALLVDSEADIVYTPVRPGVVTRDPVLEAVPNNAELRGRIWEDLDRLFAHMDVVRGGVPGSGAQLGDAALEGIRSTARRRSP